MENEDRLYYTPEMFFNDVRILRDQLISENFDMILAIARGGLVLATILANNLNIQELHTIQVKSYDENHTQQKMSVMHEPKWSCLEGKKILLVDDLIDQGTSMQFVVDLLQQHNIMDFKTAVLIDKQKNDTIRPDFYAEILKQWIVFFWEHEYFDAYC